MDKIAGVNFYNSVPKLSQVTDNEKISFCGNQKKNESKFSTTEKLLGLGALAALGIAAVMLHKSNAAKKAAKQAFENVENLQKSANAELAAKRSENPNKIIDYVEQLKIDETGAKHAKIQTEYNLMADRHETLAKRSSLADDMIMRVERLKKAEKNGLEHAKRQEYYENGYFNKGTREEALHPFNNIYGICAGKGNIFPNHPFIESIQGLSNSYIQRAFTVKIKNNEFVDSVKFIHSKTSTKKGLIHFNFKNGQSRIVGKYDFSSVHSKEDYDKMLDKYIIPHFRKYIPECNKYPSEYVKFIFTN